MRIITVLALAVILTPIALGTEIGIEPEEYQVNLTPGETHIQGIDLSWSKDSTVYVNLTTEITPSGEGINVNYSENPVKIQSQKTLEITIDTQVNLAPGEYTITTDSEQIYEHEKETEKIYTGGGGTTTITETVTEENETLRNLYKQLQETITQKESKITQLNQLIQDKNITQQQYEEKITNLTTQINKLKQDKQELIQKIKNNTTQPTKIGGLAGNLSGYIASATTLLTLIILYLYLKHRQTQKVKEEEND